MKPGFSAGRWFVVLIPFLRKLITDKAETLPAETPTTACRAALLANTFGVA